MNRTQFLIGLVAVAVIALGVAAYFVFFQQPSGDGGVPAEATLSFTVTDRDRTLGSRNAPVTMIEYAAPTCPVCARFNNDLFPQLKREYIDTGKVYYVFRVFPLQAADVAAEAIARCFPKDQYFSFIDLLYRNQARWDPDGYEIPDVHAALLKMANIAGMPAAKADSCINDQAETKRIEQVGQDAQTRYGVSGTPTFLVNGRMHGPFVEFQEVRDFIDPMLGKK
jgi:protein-disulfide isomerase